MNNQHDHSAGQPAATAGRTLDRALDLVRFLRANCDWDAAQTPDSLLPYLIEEAQEVAEAVSDRDETNLTGELGDLLLNVAFQVVLAEERAAFSAEEVVTTLEQKMRRRHPHLYGDGPKVPWEELKATERGAQKTDVSILQGLPRGLDPLSLAHRIQDRVAAVGFDWPDTQGPLDKVSEEVEEVREAIASADSAAIEDELGDLLFAAVNLSRLAGVHPTQALRAANRKFTDRFEKLERMAVEQGVKLGEVSLEVLDQLWDAVKAADAS
jgi:tetrapyrrole methylase family protein / MazG family protein